MNPHILALKFFILLSTTQVTDKTESNSLDHFVTEKIGAYDSFLYSTPPSFKTVSNPQNSILHQHQVMSRQKLAIFCKMEHEVAKASGFAVKFRLGDQSFVDQLEGK